MYSLLPQAAADYSRFVVVFLSDCHTHTLCITLTSRSWSRNETRGLVLRPSDAVSEREGSCIRTMKTYCRTGEELVPPNRREEWWRESFSSLRCNSGLLALQKSRLSHFHTFSFSYLFKENDNCWHSGTYSEFLSLKKTPTNYSGCATDIIILSLHASVQCFLS